MDATPSTSRTYQCIQRAGSDDWVVAFNDPLSFHAISSKTHLNTLFATYSTVVLLGVFDWSNYSRQVFREMAEQDIWFVEKQIGVGVVCLGNAQQLEAINQEAYEHYLKQNTEPVLFCFLRGKLMGAHAGPESIASILNWLENMK